jgi:hypothetical protein
MKTKTLTFLFLLIAGVLQAQTTVDIDGGGGTLSTIDSNATVDLVLDNSPDKAVTLSTSGTMRKTDLIDIDSIVRTRVAFSTYVYREENDSLFLDSAGTEVKVIWPE